MFAVIGTFFGGGRTDATLKLIGVYSTKELAQKAMVEDMDATLAEAIEDEAIDGTDDDREVYEDSGSAFGGEHSYYITEVELDRPVSEADWLDG